MLKKIPVHPLFFAIYPILFLYTYNISMLEITHIFIPLFWSIFGVVIMWSVLNLFLRDRFKSSAITSLITILFFSYGHMIVALNTIPENIFGISSSLYVSINYLLILSIGGYLLIKYVTNFLVATGYLNLIAFILLVFPLYAIFINLSPYQVEGENQKQKFFSSNDKIQNSEIFEKPDIYYIVLDGYGRNDILDSVYEFNNESFISELKKRGFKVSSKSTSNYGQTLLSLAATMNMEYLDKPNPEKSQIKLFRNYLSSKIKNSRIVNILSNIGYKIVTFSSGYTGTDIKDSDVYISPVYSLDEFDNMILATTPLITILNILPNKSPTYLHKLRIIQTFQKIPKVSKTNGPIFLFAHVVAPHPPFILLPEGTEPDIQVSKHIDFKDGSHYHFFVDSLVNIYRTRYILQLTEVNKLVIKMIDNLFLERNKNFIMIIQSDHGPASLMRWEKAEAIAFSERFSILNAYYFGNKNPINYPDRLSSVNTFRYLLNSLFKTNYPILENKHYFATWESPHELEEIFIEF